MLNVSEAFILSVSEAFKSAVAVAFIVTVPEAFISAVAVAVLRR